MKHLALLAPLALGAFGCDATETQPRYLLQEERVLAIRADPPVVEVNAETTLSALVVHADGTRAAPALEWRACNPWQFVLEPGTDCGADASLPLPDGVLRPAAVLERFPLPTDFGRIEDAVPIEQEGCAEAVPTLDLPVVLETEVDGVRLVAIKRVPLPAPGMLGTRRNPELGDLRVDGSAVPEAIDAGREYELQAVPQLASLDVSCNGDDRVLESVRVHLYTTAGELDNPTIDVEHDAEGTQFAETAKWRAPEEGEDATLWLVAVDGEGGVDWRGYDLLAR